MCTPSSRILRALCAVLLARAVQAQSAPADVQRVNAEWERYWRVLQIAGDVPEHPWSSRAFGPMDIAQLEPTREHPWMRAKPDVAFRAGPMAGKLAPAQVKTIFNSAVPFGYNEGPMWAGRGLTGSLTLGATAAAGPFSASLAPTLFEAQNASFALLDNGLAGRLAYGMPYPWAADLPQRFGNRPYAGFDPGNSWLRVDAAGVTAGISTAAEHWGPARDHPIVLGSNAGGFPHLFLGTASPVRAGPVRVQAKVIWARLSQSDYTFMDTIARHRLSSGAILVVSPVAVPGLELGVDRFVHTLWPDAPVTMANALRPLGRLVRLKGANIENQIGSVFGRWVLPSAGVEVYGEYGREDGAVSVRNFLQELDHSSGYLLGFQRVWSDGSAGRSVARAEVLNTRSGTPHLSPNQNPFYVHSPVSQGHTQRGLALGSAGGFGGGAATIAYDRYTPRGRWTVSWTRLMRAEYLTGERGWVPVPDSADVFHALGVDGILFRGKLAWTYELTGVYELNRNFRSNVFSLRASSGARFTW